MADGTGGRPWGAILHHCSQRPSYTSSPGQLLTHKPMCQLTHDPFTGFPCWGSGQVLAAGQLSSAPCSPWRGLFEGRDFPARDLDGPAVISLAEQPQPERHQQPGRLRGGCVRLAWWDSPQKPQGGFSMHPLLPYPTTTVQESLLATAAGSGRGAVGLRALMGGGREAGELSRAAATMGTGPWPVWGALSPAWGEEEASEKRAGRGVWHRLGRPGLNFLVGAS